MAHLLMSGKIISKKSRNYGLFASFAMVWFIFDLRIPCGRYIWRKNKNEISLKKEQILKDCKGYILLVDLLPQ